MKHQARPEARPRKRHNLRVIDENARRVSTSKRTSSSVEIPFPLFVLSVSALTACIILNVAQQALVSQLSYQTEMVKKEIQIAQQEQDKLLARKAKLESPQRIESVAINKLSMVKAPKISYLRVAVDSPEPALVKNSAEH